MPFKRWCHFPQLFGRLIGICADGLIERQLNPRNFAVRQITCVSDCTGSVRYHPILRTWLARPDSHREPRAYEAPALTLSYRPMKWRKAEDFNLTPFGAMRLADADDQAGRFTFQNRI